MKNLKAGIIAHAKKLPDQIRLRDVRKIYIALEPNIPFTDFVDLFQSCTGYLLKGSKLKKALRYRDPLLRSIAYEIYKKGLNLPPQEGVLVYKISNNKIFDYRHMLASMITSTLLYSLPFKSRRGPNGLVPMELDKRIAEAITDAPRWKAPRLVGMLEKLREKGFATLDKHEFKLLNVAEARAIGIIAWHASWRRNKQNFERIFLKFLRKVGPADIPKYGKAVGYPPKVETNPEKYCLHEFGIEDVRRYAKQRGIRLEKLALTHEQLRNLLIHELESDFVPIFFERKPSTFQVDFRLLDTNDLGGLCYSLPEAKSTIIDGAHKGRVFERFLLDLLTGNIAVEPAPSEWHAASFYLVELLEKPIQKQDIILYKYRPPKGFQGIRLKRDRSSVAFRPFLEAEGLQEFDIDLLLIHDDDPKHILVGECKFTKRYNDELYRESESKVAKLAEFIDNSRGARSELRLPLNFKVLPALFTSYSGPVLAQSNHVIKSTLHTTVFGLFKFWVTQILTSETYL